jgi:hypothetical protein
VFFAQAGKPVPLDSLHSGELSGLGVVELHLHHWQEKSKKKKLKRGIGFIWSMAKRCLRPENGLRWRVL